MTTAISLFSGIGGGDIALEAAGVDILAMCEKDGFCQDILKQHFPDTPLYSDIESFDPSDFGNVDILLTTFPCQSQSVAGKRLGDKDDRWLWKENLKFIRTNRPIFVIGENVKGMLTKGLREVESDLREEGYQVRSYLLAAKDIGALHQRERVFVIGYKARGQTTNTSGNGCNGESRSRRYSQTNERAEKGEEEAECFERRSSLRTLLSKPVTESWRTVPTFRGVDDGLPLRLDKTEKQRIKALGNSVMPQQIYPFIKSCQDFIIKEEAMQYNFNKDTTDTTIRRRLKREGLSDKKIDSFIRGWTLVKNNKENK